jgi:two-component system, NarL family, sensor histidine kinase UhpB
MSSVPNASKGFPLNLSERLLSLPTMIKVLIANCLIVLIGAVVGTWATSEVVRSSPGEAHLELLVLFALGGATLSLGVNYLVLRAAFAPITALVETAQEVRRGNLDRRTPRLPVTDPRIEHLRETMNSMLDSLVSHRRQLQALSSQVLAAQEEERKRISRELHDETAQALTSLLVRLRLVEGARDLVEVRRQTAELRELTASVLEEVRKLASELRPTMLDHLGLVAALEWYSREYSQRLGISVEFRAEGALGRLPPAVELVLYRVVQEAVTNIARHAHATSASIDLYATDQNVTAEIKDNGSGFDVERVTHNRETGLGLFGMKERVALIGGACEITSTIGEGTRVFVRVPIDSWVASGGVF